MSFLDIVSFGAVVGLALVHLFSGKLRFLRGSPRSLWLSAAGGISVAYVFMHLLHEIGTSQNAIDSEVGVPLAAYLEGHVYLVALLGLVLFYGLEEAAAISQEEDDQEEGGGSISGRTTVFWLHIAMFSVYNGFIGYVLVDRQQQGLQALLLYSVAIALHFAVNAYSLREQHGATHASVGRWVLAGALLSGWTIGFLAGISEAVLAVLLAFLAGGITLNTLTGELPGQRKSTFWAFALGALSYAALLLVL